MKLTAPVLSVADLSAAVAFYEAMGFRRQQGGGALAFMSDGEHVLALATADVVAMATGRRPGAPGATGIVLAFLARSQADVTAVLAQAAEAGGSIVRAAEDGAWGGYGGSFADRDGHVWTVVHNPALYRA